MTDPRDDGIANAASIALSRCDAPPLDATTLVDALRQSSYSSLRQIHVRVDRAEVVLLGEVPNYHMKQTAQHVALSLVGPAALRNELTVTRR